MQNQVLAQRIKNTCKQKKIAVKTLLEDCGMNRNTMYDLEKKQIFPASDKISRIADYLDVSVDYLLGRTNKPEIVKEESFTDCQGQSVTNPVNVVIQDLPSQKTEPAPQAEKHSEPDVEMLLQLDNIDRAEIRGEMRQMLKAEKYRTHLYE